MKNNNYYAIHKNKTAKNKLNKVDMKKTYLFISKMTEFVNAARECAIALQKIRVASQPIPKYKKGGIENDLAIVGDNSKSEFVIDCFKRDPKFSKEYNKITEYAINSNKRFIENNILLCDTVRKSSLTIEDLKNFSLNTKPAN